MASFAATPALYPRAWYAATIAEFLAATPLSVLGEIAGNSGYDETPEQRNTWRLEIEILREVLQGRDGLVALEFNIPRMGHRADAVLLLGAAVVVLEFKVMSTPKIDRAAIHQVWDYALDLNYFHKASHNPPIVPVLVVPDASSQSSQWIPGPDRVYVPIVTNRDGLRSVLASAAAIPGPAIVADSWYRAPYHPTPGIIEAARALYAQHTVAEIASSEAGTAELAAAIECLRGLAREARDQRRRVICFLTGVPGAGKTLVGLDLATERTMDGQPHAVYLSGNGPLVAVLRAALIRDEKRRRAKMPAGERPAEPIAQSVKSFIQNVHEFRNEALNDPHVVPPEHVAIFDEAQRAWTRERLADWLSRRKGKSGFEFSEPEFLIATLEREPDWAMIVCLVGEGQEINSGEAGIGEWFRAIAQRFPHWQVYAPPGFAATAGAPEAWAKIPRRTSEPSLHLAVSRRSFRAENLSAFVQALLECDRDDARNQLARLRDRYPIALTRDLEEAKQWVRERAQGSQRFGLLATSKAVRLKPHAVDVRIKVDPVHWFLDGPEDLRSSFALEDAATEFDVQGLELDWACAAWDGDMRHAGLGWTFHKVLHKAGHGSRWVNNKTEWGRIYARNAYRVLLTRARLGMVICVPRGHAADPTRQPAFYDATYEYLAGLGIEPA